MAFIQFGASFVPRWWKKKYLAFRNWKHCSTRVNNRIYMWYGNIKIYSNRINAEVRGELLNFYKELPAPSVFIISILRTAFSFTRLFGKEEESCDVSNCFFFCEDIFVIISPNCMWACGEQIITTNVIVNRNETVPYYYFFGERGRGAQAMYEWNKIQQVQFIWRFAVCVHLVAFDIFREGIRRECNWKCKYYTTQ